ncbi:MAG: SDR family NAD(P)-dependent oxidoreductase [Kofleriaceae bacterium]
MLALVTGASSGIGRAFAQRLGKDGNDLIVVGRRQDRLDELANELSNVKVTPVVADLATPAGVEAVAAQCGNIDLLVNNAGVSHYMPFAELPLDKLAELIQVKVYAPTVLARAAVPGMLARGRGSIINVAGMLGFSGPVKLPLKGTVYRATLAHLVTFSQALADELAPTVRVQVCCPGVVATEFHSRQGMDLSKVPRMTPEDVVTASLAGLAKGEVVCAPGVENAALLETVYEAERAAFGGQSPALASRYR